MTSDWFEKARSTKSYDLLIAAPLIVLLAGSGAARFGSAATALAEVTPADASTPDFWLAIASQAALAVLAWLQLAFLILRSVPVRRMRALLPRLVAVLGSTGTLSMTLLPRADVGETAEIVSVVLILAGAAGAVASLMSLRCAFSIMPEARALVTSGPYRHLRHPLYAAEMMMIAGAAILFRQPLAALIAAAVLATMLARMRYEERVLSETFPLYLAYAERTKRLFPMLY